MSGDFFLAGGVDVISRIHNPNGSRLPHAEPAIRLVVWCLTDIGDWGSLRTMTSDREERGLAAAGRAEPPARVGEAVVPVAYAEKTMSTLLRLHEDLVEEKERRIDLYRRLMDREQELAELRAYVRLLESELARRDEEQGAIPPPPPAPDPVPAPAAAPPAPSEPAPEANEGGPVVAWLPANLRRE